MKKSKTIDQLETRIIELEELIGMNDVSPIAIPGLQKLERSILGALLSRKFVDYEALKTITESTATRLTSNITRINLALKLCDARIKNVYGEGYYITAEDKDKIHIFFKIAK